MMRLRCLLFALAALLPLAADPAHTLTVDCGVDAGPARPVIGFLGGLRDTTPDELLKPLNPGLWRIGHQFRGRLKGGLNAAIDRVEALGARYKLVMSDLIQSKPKDWAVYEADVKKLALSVGPRAKTVIWEPVNEPDISHKPIETYYDLYAHACKALREVEPAALLCGPGYAFPNYDRCRRFLEACRERGVECNYLAWHYTGWDPEQPTRGRWGLERLHELSAQFPAQKLREIHCDEWGAGPDKPTKDSPGRLQPGRAVVWFWYLEQVWKVDRACRANWGKEDDWLGGLVTAGHEPHPAFQAYRLYGQQQRLTRVAVTGNGPKLAALAGRADGRVELLLGNLETGTRAVTVELQHLGLAQPQVSVKVIPVDDLNGVVTFDKLPEVAPTVVAIDGGLRVTLPAVVENQAYSVVVRGR